jgi:imidazolonepropionase-like amidohydrolase
MIRIGREGDPTGDVARATIRKMVEGGVAMTSTMAVIEPFIPSRPTEDERTLSAMAPEIREAYLDTRAQFREAGENFPFTEDFLKKAMAFEREFVKAGGLLACGVDPTGIGGALQGFGDQRNEELLVEAGFTAEEAVQICTGNGAKILGVDRDIGTVEAGKVADLVVLDGDLASAVSVIRNVTIVFKDGVGYDSPALIESVQGLVGVR